MKTLETPQRSPSTLSNEQREQLVSDFNRDGFVVLPIPLDENLRADCEQAIDRMAEGSPDEAVVQHHCVSTDPAFLRLMCWRPALELCVDLLGPNVQLNQSNAMYRPKDDAPANFKNGAVWHADGPRPQFPSRDGVMDLHYLKFGYFLTDLQSGEEGSLQAVRGSHRRVELDGLGGDFDIDSHRDRLVSFDVPAGSVVAFHQALWHAAPNNRSERPRKNCYYSYSYAWMRPFDHVAISEEEAIQLDPTEAFLLGGWRSPQEYWCPKAPLINTMDPYART